MPKSARSILDLWGITPAYLTLVCEENPSLRGMILGYIGERKLREFLQSDPRITNLRKDDDHDRARKGDLVIAYRGREFKLEVKSLQTNSIKLIDASGASIPMMLKRRIEGSSSGRTKYTYVANPDFLALSAAQRESGRYVGCVQCDASDKRPVKLPSGDEIVTTNLVVGGWDILAAGAFAFREKWDFGFALNRDLPKSTNYAPEVNAHLIKTLIPLTWPLEPPFVPDPFQLLDRLYRERRRSRS